MMKKLRLTLYFVVINTALLYIALWFYFSTELKHQLTNQLGNIAEAHNLEFSFEQIRTSGFPLKIKMEVDKPYLVIKSTDGNVIINGDSFAVETNLLGKKFNAILGSKFHFQILENDQKNPKNNHQYNLDLPHGSYAGVTLKSYSLLQLLRQLKNTEQTSVRIIKEFLLTLANISEITFENRGVAIRSSEDMKLYLYFSSSSSSLVNQSNKLTSKIIFKSDTNASGVKYISGDYRGSANLEINIDHSEAADWLKSNKISLLLKDLSYTTEETSVNLAGQFISEKNSLLPTGEVKVKIHQYDKLLELLLKAKIIDNIEQNKVLLLKLASDSAQAADIEFSITRMADQAILLGNMKLQDVLKEYLRQ